MTDKSKFQRRLAIDLLFTTRGYLLNWEAYWDRKNITSSFTAKEVVNGLGTTISQMNWRGFCASNKP